MYNVRQITKGMVNMEIQYTRDYSIFKKMSGNRLIDQKHLRRLRLSIEKENQLALHPIIVNKDLSVIDGQHRLEIARQLGIEVYYLQSDTVSDAHLIEGNSNQKSWEIDNFIDFYCTRDKKEEYIKLKKFMNETGLKTKAIISLLIGNVSPVIIDFLKTGKFAFPKLINHSEIIEFYQQFISYVDDKNIKPMSMFTNFQFTKALRWMFLTSGFSTDTFFRKLDQKWFELKPQRVAEDWYKLLINIYNFKNNDKISDEWSKNNTL